MKKRILFLESRFDSFYGAQKSMLKLIKSLDQNHFNYNVVTTEQGKLKNGLEQNDLPVDVVRLGRKANVFGGEVLRYSIFTKMIVALQILFYNLKLVNYILRNSIDIIYVNDLRALLYAVLASKLTRKKIVWYIRMDLPNSKLTEFGLRFSDKIITIAHGVLRNLSENKIEKYRHKITNIYTGFSFKDFKIYDKNQSKVKLGISEKKQVIGYLGSINERKGLDILVEAFIELYKSRNDIELLVVGDVSPGFETYWNNQLSKLQESNVRFKHLPFSNEVSSAYSAMDIFVLPSRSEGLPRVIIEAMSHQVPVISTDVGGTKEIISSNKLGILIKKDDKIQLINSINEMLNSPAQQKALVEYSFMNVKERFSEEAFSKHINEFFNNLNK